MTLQIDVLYAQKCNCLSRCVRARIFVLKSDPSSMVGFPDSLKNNWQTIGCVPRRIFCVVLVVRLRHVQFFRKNRRIFAWKCLVREQLLLDLAHLETPIQSTAVYFRAKTHKSTIHHLSRCHRRVSKHSDRILELLFRPIDTSLFLSD